jgi:hypothetical protein
MIKQRSLQLAAIVGILVLSGIFATAVASGTCGPEEEPVEIETKATETMKVGEATELITKNLVDHAVTLDEDSSTNESVLKRIKTSCKGSLGSTASCNTRWVECVGVGTAEWSVVATDSGGMDVSVVKFKCD